MPYDTLFFLLYTKINLPSPAKTEHYVKTLLKTNVNFSL